MAKQVTLRDRESQEVIYPTTNTNCVYDNDGQSAEERLAGMQKTVNSAKATGGYYTCSTGAAVAEKVVTIPDFVLDSHARFLIMFDVANTADNVTLNISDTGAKPLYYNGALASSSNSWKASEILDIYYDGANWRAKTSLEVDDSYGGPYKEQRFNTFSKRAIMSQNLAMQYSDIDGYQRLMPMPFAEPLTGTKVVQGPNINVRQYVAQHPEFADLIDFTKFDENAGMYLAVQGDLWWQINYDSSQWSDTDYIIVLGEVQILGVYGGGKGASATIGAFTGTDGIRDLQQDHSKSVRWSAGSSLFYAGCVKPVAANNTVLLSVNSLSSSKDKPTVVARLKQFKVYRLDRLYTYRSWLTMQDWLKSVQLTTDLGIINAKQYSTSISTSHVDPHMLSNGVNSIAINFSDDGARWLCTELQPRKSRYVCVSFDVTGTPASTLSLIIGNGYEVNGIYCFGFYNPIGNYNRQVPYTFSTPGHYRFIIDLDKLAGNDGSSGSQVSYYGAIKGKFSIWFQSNNATKADILITGIQIVGFDSLDDILDYKYNNATAYNKNIAESVNQNLAQGLASSSIAAERVQLGGRIDLFEPNEAIMQPRPVGNVIMQLYANNAFHYHYTSTAGNAWLCTTLKPVKGNGKIVIEFDAVVTSEKGISMWIADSYNVNKHFAHLKNVHTRHARIEVDVAEKQAHDGWGSEVSFWFGNESGELDCTVFNIQVYALTDKVATSNFSGETLPEVLTSIDNKFTEVTTGSAEAPQDRSTATIYTSPDGTKYITQIGANGQVIAVPVVPRKTVMIGNSLIIGSGFGMAASDEHHDYLYLFSTYVQSLLSTATVVKQISYVEGVTNESGMNNAITSTVDAIPADCDLIVIQLGDNTNTDEKRAFANTSYPALVKAIRVKAPNARIVWMGIWFEHSAVVATIKLALKQYGGEFMHFSDCFARTSADNSYIGAVQHMTGSATRTVTGVTDVKDNGGGSFTVKFANGSDTITTTITDVTEQSLSDGTWTYKSYNSIITQGGVAMHPGDSGFLKITNALLYFLGISDSKNTLS